MTGAGIAGFAVWLAVGIFFIGNGLWCFKAKKPSGFWANARVPEIRDTVGYNRAMGKLWCVYGAILILLGIPLLLGAGVWIMVSVVGVMAETVGAMVVYTIGIEPRYRKR